jgi:hypothetical protein
MLSTPKIFWSASLVALSVVSLGGVCALAQQAQHCTPQNPAVAVDPAMKLQALHREAVRSYAGINSYVVRLRRREQVGGQNKPEEVMLLKFRKAPWSVYLKFLGPVGRGREVVYVKGHYEDKIHTLTAAGDIPLAPAGRHIALAPDSILVRSASRHPITEAGIGNLVEQFGRLLEYEQRSAQRGTPAGLVNYLGAFQRPEFANRLDTVVQVVPPKFESALPRGGRRYWFFEPNLHLPVLIITQDDKNHEVEYYSYEDLQTSVAISPEDSDPDQMGKHR